MINNLTKLTSGQNEHFEVQTIMDEAGMVVVKIIFCITVFLSFTVTSNGQSMTFAEDDINQTPMGTYVTGNILTNDCDPSVDNQWLRSIVFFDGLNSHFGQIGGRAFGLCSENGISAGTISFYLDGSYEFNPAPDFKGKVAIKYVVENASGATDAATLVIQVIPPNNPIRNNKPIAHNDTNTTEMNMDVAGNVITSNDYDSENDPLSINGAFADLDGDGAIDESLTVGTGTAIYGKNMAGDPRMAGVITLNSDGSYNFEPAGEFYGKLAIKYNLTDGINLGVSANLTILVLPETGNMGFANDDVVIGKMNMLQSGNILANDQGPTSDLQTIIAAKNNRGLSLVIDGITENELRSSGSFTMDTDGSFTYSPKRGFVGTESIAYVTCDDTGSEAACDTATLYLTTIPFNGMGMGSTGTINGRSSERFSTTSDLMEGNANVVAEEFTLYPNPGIVGDGFINLRFESISDKAEAQIFDMNGRLIRQLAMDVNAKEINNLQIDVAELVEGRYQLQLIDGANVYSETFILINKN